MKLSEFKNHLSTLKNINFVLPNGNFVPRHFHITEAGLVTKHFIDCGGDVHTDKTIVLQIWVAEDFDHRLKPAGLLNIFNISKGVLGDEDLEVEVEYQTETIGIYKLAFQTEHFVLQPKFTDCLAKVTCGIPETKLELANESSCCEPGGGCC